MSYEEAERICIKDGKEIRRKLWDVKGTYLQGQFLHKLSREDRKALDWYVVNTVGGSRV